MRELRSFQKGMDKDSSPLLMPEGRYRDALNVYSGSVDGMDEGTIVPQLGNKEIQSTLPGGENVCIGTCENIELDSIIYFIWNSEDNHSILQYAIGSPSAQVILTSSELNFKRDRRIRANVLEGLLYWTDGYFNTYIDSDFNPPRKINIGREYASIDAQVLDRIKYPPWDAPKSVYFTDEERASNFMYGFLFQFRYRYIYDDNERSVWSPISKTAIPPNIESSEGRGSVESRLDNSIRVTMDSGHHTVKRVEVAVRVGNSRPFGIFKTIDRDGIDDFSPIEVVFTNNEAITTLSEEENGKNYDRVPQISQDEELIQGNRLVDANIVEGYDTVSTEGTKAEPDLVRRQFREIVNYSFNSVTFIDTDVFITLPEYTNINEGDRVVFNIGGAEYTEEFTETPASQALFWDSLRDMLEGNGFNVINQIPPNYEILRLRFDGNEDNPFQFVQQVPLINFTRLKSFKVGTYHPIGIVYKDRGGRTASVMTNDDMNMYVPFHSESDMAGSLYSSLLAQYRLKLTIDHTPPEWATHYSVVVRDKSRINSFGQWSVKRSGIQGGGTRLKVFLDTLYQNESAGVAIRHEILEGDVLRLITKGEDSPEDQTFTSTYREFRVVEYIADENAVLLDYNELFSEIESGQGNDGALVEIYRPRRVVDDNSALWREIGQEHPILNPHTADRTHGYDESILVSVDDSGPLVMVIEEGDVYVRTRRMFDFDAIDGDSGLVSTNDRARRYWVEDYHFSDYYESDWHDYGRFHTLDPDARRLELKTGLRYSEVFVQNTLFNGLSSVDDGAFDSVRDVHGPIQRIIEVGFTLKVLQSQKVTSIYLGRNILFNADGTTNVAQSDSVLGTKNPSEDDYGTIHPDSLVKDSRNLYFFDAMNGMVIRDSPNGMAAISENGMRRFFSQLGGEYRSRDSYVLGGLDREYNTVYFTFKGEDEIRPALTEETVGFDTLMGNWITRCSWRPEMMGNRGELLFTFVDGRIWQQNALDQRNTFYGEVFNREVEVIFNQDPTKLKSARAIAIESDGVWFCPEDGDVSSLAAHYLEQDTTRIIEERVQEEGGVYYASVPRALNTVGVTDPIVNGKVVKGRAFKVRLRSPYTDDVYLLGARLNYANSERSGI